ncbi:hypothetical protein [Chroococcidiopsis cubana]|uniref:hypothetical protein n=1 Tax=Chroococcidiopsis cubana TaxID=171392 RepID=UPI001F53F875|nr:hypothetical protein [Chroococcidiopsis cubana]
MTHKNCTCSPRSLLCRLTGLSSWSLAIAAKNFALLGGALRTALGLAFVLPVVGGASVGFWQSTPRGAVALTSQMNP